MTGSDQNARTALRSAAPKPSIPPDEVAASRQPPDPDQRPTAGQQPDAAQRTATTPQSIPAQDSAAAGPPLEATNERDAAKDPAAAAKEPEAAQDAAAGKDPDATRDPDAAEDSDAAERPDAAKDAALGEPDAAKVPAHAAVEPVDPARHRRPGGKQPRTLLVGVANTARRAAVGTGRAALRTGPALRTATAATGRWALRPSGRFVIPVFAVLAVLAGTATVGQFVVPTLGTRPAAGAVAAGDPGLPSLPPPDLQPTEPMPLPTGDGTAATPQPGELAHPQDALAAWAQRIAPVVNIPAVAMQAYGYAQLSAAQTKPGCHITWTTLAGIGTIESGHGSAGGAVLEPDGLALPPIIGPTLDGTNGQKRILDTDQGEWDGDRTYDHAVGPMQFIPDTWRRSGIDADHDGKTDPNDINDAALAAANYLCAGGLDLTTETGWWAAIYSYNAVRTYAQNVFTAANNYGVLSKTVT